MEIKWLYNYIQSCLTFLDKHERAIYFLGGILSTIAVILSALISTYTAYYSAKPILQVIVAWIAVITFSFFEIPKAVKFFLNKKSLEKMDNIEIKEFILKTNRRKDWEKVLYAPREGDIKEYYLKNNPSLRIKLDWEKYVLNDNFIGFCQNLVRKHKM